MKKDGWAYVLAKKKKKTSLSQLHTGGQGPDFPKTALLQNIILALVTRGFPCGSAGIESACNEGRPGFNTWVGKIPWRREGLSTPFSGLENSMDCIVHGIAKCQAWQGNFHFTIVTEQPLKKWLQSSNKKCTHFYVSCFPHATCCLEFNTHKSHNQYKKTEIQTILKRVINEEANLVANFLFSHYLKLVWKIIIFSPMSL